LDEVGEIVYMNIIEAVKSGRPIRRKGVWKDWISVIDQKHSNGGYFFAWHGDPNGYLCTDQDILADDWEIQEEKVTITRGEFEKAVDECVYDGRFDDGRFDYVMAQLKAKLFDDK
jgi:hypothetical protein